MGSYEVTRGEATTSYETTMGKLWDAMGELWKVMRRLWQSYGQSLGS